MTNASTPNGGEDGDQPKLPSEAVVEAVAEETGTDPTELPPLYDAIDPEALNQLFAGRDSGTVSFSCCDCEVTVKQNGTISVQSE